MIFWCPRVNTDIFPEPPEDENPNHVAESGEPAVNSPSLYLALPTEVRLQIHYYYLLFLNIPDRFFHHLTMVGYWDSGAGVTSRYYDIGYNLGRRVSKPLLKLLLLNHQIRLEVEEVLYRHFIFLIDPALSRAPAVHDFYSVSGKGARLAPRLRNIQINLSLKARFGHPPSSSDIERWRGALEALVKALPELHTIGLAVDYLPVRGGTVSMKKEMLDVIVSLAGVFKSVENVHLRFVEVEHEQYGHLAPVSSPVCARLLEEEALLLHLRDEKKLIWHSVAKHFQDPKSELYSVTGLQARYERLKVRQLKVEMESECLRMLAKV